MDEICLSQTVFYKQLQSALADAGCQVGAIDGILGKKSRTWLAIHDVMWAGQSYQDLLDQGRADDMLARVEIMAEQVCQTAFDLSPECQTLLVKWRKQPGAGAFAVSAMGGCATAAGYASTAQARGVAMGNCQKTGLPCRVAETSGAKAAKAAPTCAPSATKYAQAQAHKALASGSNGCYFAAGARSKAAARRQALRHCKAQGAKGCTIVHAE